MSLYNKTHTDEHGVLRYKKNKLICWLYDTLQIDMNVLWIAYQEGLFSREEFQQFYRDIGYSVDGYRDVWEEK